MLQAYQRMQANGAIGPMEKVDAAGNVIVDPAGEKQGTLRPRAFVEYPKAVRRYKDDGSFETFVAHSKSEELKIIAERPSVDEPRSPLERERDELALRLSEQSQLNGSLLERLDAMARTLEELTQAKAGEKPVAAAVAAASAAPGEPAKTVQAPVDPDVMAALSRMGGAAKSPVISAAEQVATAGAKK